MESQKLIFCRVEDIDVMNNEEEAECEYCLGTGVVEIKDQDYDCEYCDLIECLYSSDEDVAYKPDWSEDNDTEEDSDIDILLTEECGSTCNEVVCYCGSV